MAEKSYTWDTNGTGDAPVAVASGGGWTEADIAVCNRIRAACSGFEGVAPGYVSELLPAANGANTVRVAPGGGMVDGHEYDNTANVDVNVPSAVGAGNTRIDRIVLRCGWAAQTVRITRIAGTDAALPSAPALTQTSGTTYDISLCTVLVDTSGAVTVTDARTWAQGEHGAAYSVKGRASATAGAVADILPAQFDTVLGVTAAGGVEWQQVSEAMVADDAVTPGKILDRTRKLWVSPSGGYNTTTTANITLGPGGVTLPDNAESYAQGFFAIPSDYVSTLSVVPYILQVVDGGGNVRVQTAVNAGADGELYTVHATAGTATDVAAPGSQGELKALAAETNASAAANDIVTLVSTRYGAHGNDTHNNPILFVGWAVSYTADS
jgi:hypothetical protein